MPPQDQNNNQPLQHDGETQLPTPVQPGSPQPTSQENHTDLPSPLGADNLPVVPPAPAQTQENSQPAPQQFQFPESSSAAPQQQPPTPPAPSSIPPNNAAQAPFESQGSPGNLAQAAALDAMGGGEVPDDPPPKLGPLAQQYGQYEASLYTSGIDFDQIEQKLAEWRQQYANGASAMEILYGPEEDTATPAPEAGQPTTPQIPNASPQPTTPSQSTAPDKMPEDGELRIR